MNPILKRIIPILLALNCGGAVVLAGEVKAGPNGGRMLEAEAYQAEFLVTAERRVEVTFFDEAMTPVAPASQQVDVMAERPGGGRKKLAMQPTETAFVSVEPLPVGEPYRVVVQIRPTPEARPKNFRIDLNLAVCGGCSLAEYACICEGH